MKDLLNWRENLEKKPLTNEQKKVFTQLVENGGRISPLEYYNSQSLTGVLNRLAGLSFVKHDPGTREYTITEWGRQAFERGWYKVAPRK